MNSIVRELGGIESRESVVAIAAQKTGDVVQTLDGMAAIVLGARDYAIGEEMPVTLDAIVDVDSAAATLFAAGATVRFDLATKLAVTTGGIGLGTAMVAKTNGQTKVRCRINRQKIA